MKHLILGSEGQIGKYVCDEVERNDDEVIRWDIVLDDKHDLRKQWAGFPGPLIETMREVDFVHFLAYDVGGSSYLAKKQNSFEYINNNIMIMKNVFDALTVTEKPFYFASSQMANMTDSVYGQLKAVGESYTKALGGINLRFWNIYGYESDPEKTHVITDFIKMALRDGQILCRTNGEEKRHFTHAKEAAVYLYHTTKYYDNLTKDFLTQRGGRSFEPFDWYPLVGQRGGGWISIKEIALEIGRQLGVPVYFGLTVDKTQTIHNEIEFERFINYSERTNRAHLNVVHIDIRDGIKDMIERIKADGV